MKLFFDIQIVDEYGHIHGRRRVEIPREAAYIGNRAVDDMRCAISVGATSMVDTIQMMRVREFRKKLLTSVAAQSGAALAEHLEDREGWHGLDRQVRVESQYKA